MARRSAARRHGGSRGRRSVDGEKVVVDQVSGAGIDSAAGERPLAGGVTKSTAKSFAANGN
jgi:hypothetical protein